MNPRYRSALEHIDLYRVSVRKFIEHVHFQDQDCNNAIQFLRERGYIKERGKLPGNIACYEPTKAGLAELGASTDAQERPPLKLDVLLATLWFCNTHKPKKEPESATKWRSRELPQRKPARNLHLRFPEMPPAHHCFEIGEKARLFRLYVPGPETEVQDILRQLKKNLATATAHHELERMVYCRSYAFAVLAHTERRRAAIEEVIAKEGLKQEAHFIVEYAPDQERWKEALDALST